jgi:deoxyribonuclease-4
VLLETMAGKGSEVGSRFEELREIMDGIELGDKIGVCLDTCHISDAGYDIVKDLDGVLEEFDRVIGIGRLRAVHLNDSMNPLGSHKDRHEKIGRGTIGEEAIGRIINHPLLRDLPFYLETPNEIEGLPTKTFCTGLISGIETPWLCTVQKRPPKKRRTPPGARS